MSENNRNSSPETSRRTLSPMSKSDISYGSKMQSFLKVSQSPHKENLANEVSKLTGNSKKMMELIEQMTKREEERVKKISQQNQVIQDLQQKISILTEQGNNNQGAQNGSDYIQTVTEEESEEGQFFQALLMGFRAKQEEIDILTAKSAELEGKIQEIRSAIQKSRQLSRVQQLSQGEDINFIHGQKGEELIENENIRNNKNNQNNKSDQKVDLALQGDQVNQQVDGAQIQTIFSSFEQNLSSNNERIESLKGQANHASSSLKDLQVSLAEMKSQINTIIESKKSVNYQQSALLGGDKLNEMNATLVSLGNQVKQLQKQQAETAGVSLSYQEYDDEGESQKSKKARKQEEKQPSINYLREFFTIIAISIFFAGLKYILQKI